MYSTYISNADCLFHLGGNFNEFYTDYLLYLCVIMVYELLFEMRSACSVRAPPNSSIRSGSSALRVYVNE